MVIIESTLRMDIHTSNNSMHKYEPTAFSRSFEMLLNEKFQWQIPCMCYKLQLTVFTFAATASRFTGCTSPFWKYLCNHRQLLPKYQQKMDCVLMSTWNHWFRISVNDSFTNRRQRISTWLWLGQVQSRR